MKRFFLGLMILFLMTACSGNNASDSPTAELPAQLPPSPEPLLSSPTPVCISAEPTQEDVERALTFTGKLFEISDWTRSYTVSADRVSVLWESASLGAIAFLEIIIFPCSYEDLDLDVFFSLDSWQVVFGGYESYEFLGECHNDTGERLYEFMLSTGGFEYDANYWSVNDTATRIVTMEIIFPIESEDLFDEFSYSLFPQIPNC